MRVLAPRAVDAPSSPLKCRAAAHQAAGSTGGPRAPAAVRCGARRSKAGSSPESARRSGSGCSPGQRRKAAPRAFAAETAGQAQTDSEIPGAAGQVCGVRASGGERRDKNPQGPLNYPRFDYGPDDIPAAGAGASLAAPTPREGRGGLTVRRRGAGGPYRQDIREEEVLCRRRRQYTVAAAAAAVDRKDRG